MSQQEFYGSSVDEALKKAATSFGVSPQDIEYEVIDEGSQGFLGIGARDARIKAQTSPPATSEQGPMDSEGFSEAPAEEPDEAAASEVVPRIEAETTSDADTSEVRLEEAAADQEEAPEEVLLEVDKFLISLTSSMGLDATVDVYDAGESITAEVSTPQTGLFIGQKGETIDAVQHLTNVFASKQQERVKRIVVDSEGYRQRRTEAIQGMAHRSARRASREGRAVNLPPMSASERRVVHVYLAENPSVETSSEGNEGNRYVVISPS